MAAKESRELVKPFRAAEPNEYRDDLDDVRGQYDRAKQELQDQAEDVVSKVQAAQLEGLKEAGRIFYDQLMKMADADWHKMQAQKAAEAHNRR